MVKRDSQETTQESVSSRSEDDSRKDVPEQMNTAERQSFLELTRNIAGLPLEQSAAALETSAAIAGISLRAAIEFLRATPAAAEVLQPAELRSWGELGRRIAMSDFEAAVSFFADGVDGLRKLPRTLHAPCGGARPPPVGRHPRRPSPRVLGAKSRRQLQRRLVGASAPLGPAVSDRRGRGRRHRGDLEARGIGWTREHRHAALL